MPNGSMLMVYHRYMYVCTRFVYECQYSILPHSVVSGASRSKCVILWRTIRLSATETHPTTPGHPIFTHTFRREMQLPRSGIPKIRKLCDPQIKLARKSNKIEIHLPCYRAICTPHLSVLRNPLPLCNPSSSCCCCSVRVVFARDFPLAKPPERAQAKEP